MSSEPVHGDDDNLSHLPLDILTDHLLPLLPPSSLTHLSAANKSWNGLISGPAGEIVWRRKCERDFGFPSLNTGRRSGWSTIYARLTTQSTFVWGQSQNSRLGLSPQSPLYRRSLIQGGFPVPVQLPPLPTSSSSTPAPVIVGLEASGFGFHALTQAGKIVAWGTMDGEAGFGRPGSGALSNPGFAQEEPLELNWRARAGEKGVGRVVQVETGRKHVVLRDEDGHVWEYRSFGRCYQIPTPSEDPVIAVEAGWSHSLFLTTSGALQIWWEPSPRLLSRLAQSAAESDLPNPKLEGISFSLTEDQAGLVRLPDLPSSDGVRTSQAEKAIKVASGDHFVLALTASGSLYFLDVSPVPNPINPHAPAGALNNDDPDDPNDDGGGGSTAESEDSPVMSRESRDRLEAAFVSGQRNWRKMELFCDMEKIRELAVFGQGEGGLTRPKRDTKITSITAHFQSFCAYSVPVDPSIGDSLVLMGRSDWTPDAEPEVIPELQGKGVIKVVQGDYHHVALTSNGQLFSWGAFSAGALGLGHPILFNTPLSAPHPPPLSTSFPAPTPQPGLTQPRPRDPLFPGFARHAPLPTPPLPPSKVDKPTLIRFPGDEEVTTTTTDTSLEEHRQGGKFVFHVTASGWHTGALAVDLSDNPSADPHSTGNGKTPEERDFEAQVAAARDGGRGVDNVVRGEDLNLLRGGIFGRFRIGYAARGIGRLARGGGGDGGDQQ